MTNPSYQEIPKLQPSNIQVLPDPVRGWLKRKAKPAGYAGWYPATDAQGAALDCEADILLLGGAAGSLKSSTILVDLIQERDYSRMNSYFFRRTYPELEEAMQQAYDLFPSTGGHPRDNGREWQWPSGAHFRFRHINHEKDLAANQGKAMTAIGIDESTHLPMNWIRYLISRNRSTDPHIRTRMRLGTNPGNVGHMDHMKMFFNGVCPHCDPQLAPPQGTVLWDRTWHDGQPLTDPDTGHKISIAYILSYVRDHNLLGPQYIARLKMQSPATAKALLEGCWKIFEGQYFDCFEPNRKENPMVIPRRELNEQRWTPRWVASDYGFSISIAAAHLFLHLAPSEQFPRGRVAIADEFGCQETARDFARLVAERWILGSDGRPMEQRWMPWYLSPDSFSDDGHADSLAAQMNSVLRPYGAHFMRANNDRQGGAMKMYTGLQTGELVICAECKQTIEALESRIHDPKHENDVLKVTGDPLDDYYDSCLGGETLVATSRGELPITAVRVGDSVLTRKGYRKVLWSGMTKANAATLVVHFSEGRSLRATPDHPIFNAINGFVRFDSLRYGDIVLKCHAEPHHPKPSSLMESISADIQTANTSICEITTGPELLTEQKGLAPYIGKFGSLLMVLFHKVSPFITKTKTHCITKLGISNSSNAVDMPGIIGSNGSSVIQSEPGATSMPSDHSPRLGINRKWGAHIIDNEPYEKGSESQFIPKGNVINAAAHTTEPAHRASAPIGVSQNGAENQEGMTSQSSAISAGTILNQTNTIRYDIVQSSVVSVTPGENSAVYNLTVEEEPEFFANGILVHNCRYGAMSFETHRQVTPPVEVRIAERLKKEFSADPSTAMFNAQKIMDEENRKNKAGYYGGNVRRQMLEQEAKRRRY